MKKDSFYKGKKILITGNTGFKGSWLTLIMMKLGAEVVGYSLTAPTIPGMYNILHLDDDVHTYYQDIRDYESLMRCFTIEKPEIVFHLAAQPIVREGYSKPLYTYETNVMGTVHILECVRKSDTVRSLLNVTTDKVYYNNEWEWGYRENEILDGFDPYSNSKSCSELVTACYKRSFFNDREVAISTARAGNVIGGGDFAEDRIVPDCFRATERGENIFVRNPKSVRPYQHVLEPLGAYMLIAEKQYKNLAFAGNYNVGPESSDCITTGELADIFCQLWGNDARWIAGDDNGPHEANYLRLDCSKIKKRLGWRTTWDVYKALEETVEWQKRYLAQENMRKVTEEQINLFIDSAKA